MPRTKRPLGVLIAVLGVIFAAVAFASPASADYGKPVSSGVSDGSPSVGVAFTVSGSGFNAGEKVTIRLSGGASLGTATADSSGAFSGFSVTLPSGVSGRQIIVFTGATSGKTSSQVINVGTLAFTGSGSTTTGGTLAFTGAAVMALGSLALFLVVGGGLMMLAGRRRKAVI